MATPQQKLVQITAWSYSKFTSYEMCPLKTKLVHIDKRQEPENDALRNGTIVHRLAEQYVRGDLTKCPPELKKLADGLKMLRSRGGLRTEQEWAFDSAWNVVGWFDKSAWLRVKVDVCYDVHHTAGAAKKAKLVQETTLYIVDYKTGREKQEHSLQRSLYALGGFAMMPDIAAVVAEHWYVDTGRMVTEKFERKQEPQLRKQWEQRTRAMLNDKRFAPRPGSYCSWCFVSKKRGGPCQF